MWLSFVLYLDLRYAKFPAVLLGGIKILLAGYVVLGVVLPPFGEELRLHADAAVPPVKIR